MTDTDIAGVRQALNDRLEALQRSTDTTADSRKPVALDQAAVGRLSRMDALQMQAMAQATERLRSQQIVRVQAALKRIDDGDYGYCVACGEEIEPKRLAVDPTVPTCFDCASASRR